MTLLSVEDLVVSYGAIHALHGISLEVEEGEMLTLLGANGAGKSTTLWTIVGQIRELGGRVVSGRIRYRGEDLLGVGASQIVRRFGIALVPEGRRIFGNLTVLENLKLAAYARRDTQQVNEDLERVFAIFPRLEGRQSQLADLLSGGEQQMLAVGRALMSQPRLLVLDEPTTGLAPIVARNAYAALERLREQGLTILVAEQQVPLALAVSDRGYVLENGAIGLAGTSAELASDPRVRSAYLGVV